MATGDTTTRVVQVRVDNAEAIKLIADYNVKIEESIAMEKALREEIKKKGEATDVDRESLAKYKVEQTAYKNELREVQKEVQNNIKAARAQENSNTKLRAQLSNLTAQYDKMGAAMQDSTDGQKLKKEINDITSAIKKSEEETQRFYRNVGNYPELKPLETQLGEVRKQLAMMKYEGQENTEEFRELMGVAANMKDALADVEASINAGASDTSNLDATIKGTQNLMQLWTQWAILSKQLGVENEELNQTFAMLGQVLGGLTAMQSVANMLQQQSIVRQKAAALASWARARAEAGATAATAAGAVASTAGAVATNSFTAAVWSFTASLLASPLGLFVAVMMALVAVGYGLIKLFKAITGSSETQRESFKKQGEQLDQLGRKYDAHIERMKALGKSDAEITNTQLVLLKDLANKRAEHFALAQRLYKKDSDEFKDAQEAKKKAAEDLDKAQTTAINNLIAMTTSYTNEKMRKELGEVAYATQKANEDFKQYSLLLNEMRLSGEITTAVMYDMQKALKGLRDEAIKSAKESAANDWAAKRAQQLKTELEAVRATTDAMISLTTEGIDKERAQEEIASKRKIQDLQKRLDTEKNLTPKAREAILRQIEIAQQQHDANMKNLDQKAMTERINREAEAIALKLAAVKKGSDEEYALRIEALNKQAQADLANTKLTTDQRLLIEAKYQAEAQALRDQHTANQIQKSQEAMRLEWENKINEAALNHQNTLGLELEYRKAEIDALQRKHSVKCILCVD